VTTTHKCDEVQSLKHGARAKIHTPSVVEGDKPPCVILYDDKQIADVQRFCASPYSRGVLGIDHTFSLGKCFVTVTTFKYTDVTRHRTNEAPVFLGPCYLHWDAKSPYTLEMCVLAFFSVSAHGPRRWPE